MKYAPPYGSADPNAGYTDGNPAQGIEGSPVPADAIEHPQREIINVIKRAGIEPDEADLTQLAQAILWLAEGAAGDVGDALDVHAGQNNAHGAMVSPTPNRIAMWDAGKKLQSEDPVNIKDVVNRGYLESNLASRWDGSFNGSASWFRMPNGILIQFGTFSVPDGSVGQIVFPVSFPQAVFGVWAIDYTSTASIGSVSLFGVLRDGTSPSLSGVKLLHVRPMSGDSSSDAGYFLAIGN